QDGNPATQDGNFTPQGHENTDARLRLAVILCRQSKFKESIEHLKILHESDPGNENDTLLFFLGLALLFAGKATEGIETWKKLLAHHPEQEVLASNVFKAYYLAGRQDINENKYTEALGHWLEYLNRFPEDQVAAKGLAELYFRAGIEEINKTAPPPGQAGQQIRLAGEFFARALKLDGGNAVYRFFQALAYLKAGDPLGSSQQLFALLQNFPTDNRIKYHLGLALLQAGQKDNAMEIFTNLTNAAPPRGEGAPPRGEGAPPRGEGAPSRGEGAPSRGEETPNGEKSPDIYSRTASNIIINEDIKRKNYGRAIHLLQSLI
ncbi:MAG: tetratricopeptide repeat protein, partial [bacterium]|nr:tetratricopeptide repeat protein [bacterium]